MNWVDKKSIDFKARNVLIYITAFGSNLSSHGAPSKTNPLWDFFVVCAPNGMV